VLDHASKFRFDRRLHLRRGWIPSEQFDKELGALPDVSEKAEVIESPQSKGADAGPVTGADGE
jgi:hypothetical protein